MSQEYSIQKCDLDFKNRNSAGDGPIAAHVAPGSHGRDGAATRRVVSHNYFDSAASPTRISPVAGGQVPHQHRQRRSFLGATSSQPFRDNSLSVCTTCILGRPRQSCLFLKPCAPWLETRCPWRSFRSRGELHGQSVRQRMR